MGADLKLIGRGGAGDPCPDPEPPPLDLEPLPPAALRALVHSGENDSDACERLLAQAARMEAAFDLAIGEGLLSLLSGDRLVALGFSSLKDYAREVLDLRERSAQNLVRLARELRSRPLLRDAVRAGEVRLRAAQTILPVAIGAAEARWVERARHETVRALEAAVRAERAVSEGAPDDEWTRFGVRLSPDERTVVDDALAVAGAILPGSSRAERLEAMAQEYLGEHPLEAGDDGGGVAGRAFRRGGDPARRARVEEQLERETERWSYLSPPEDVPAPPVRIDPFATELEIDARLREVAARRRGWDEVLGYCAYMVRRSGLWRLAGFESFEHYCRERLGLGARTVEQRAVLERELWGRPALRAARDGGVPYEKLRALSHLPARELASWIPKAGALTVVELRAAVADRDEAQMRAAGVLRACVPDPVARLLQAAFRAVRAVEGRLLDDGRCLVRVARHFLATWEAHVKRPRTASQKVRERDRCRCQVPPPQPRCAGRWKSGDKPGCSRRAVHVHHVEFRSRGGGDEHENLVALCAFHHLRAVHDGYLRVSGRAPDALRWEIGPRHAPIDLRAFCLSGLAAALRPAAERRTA